MKIIQINRFWRTQGLAERYVYELSRLLCESGHEVIPFAMQDEDNEPTPYSSLFVSPVDITDPYRTPWLKRFRIAARILYSKESRNRISVLADLVRPDIAHLHNIYQHLSPSILPPLKHRGVGTVMTVHDYKLFCPALTHYNKGRVCMDCSPGRYTRCVTGRCVKNSWTSSLLCATETFLHELFHVYSSNVDVFIVPSRFVASKFAERGLGDDRVAVIPGFVDTSRWVPGDETEGDYILYAGRLTPEKGIGTMVRALALLPHIRLKVAGSGMIQSQARQLALSLGAENIEFIGYKGPVEMLRLMQNCRFTIVAPQGYENVPRPVLEGFACGKPSVASRIGGLPEVVLEGQTGLLAPPGDVEGLSAAVDELWQNRKLRLEMAGRTRDFAQKNFSVETHLRKVVDVYERVKRT